MSTKFPLTNINKTIYDPFANAQEVSIDATQQTERREYQVHRACGHCGGTGKRKDDKTPGLAKQPKCSQCILGKHVRGRQATNKGMVEVWGREISLYAHELNEDEVNHLEPQKKLGAIFEIGQHAERRLRARIQADEEYEGTRTVVVSRVRGFI